MNCDTRAEPLPVGPTSSSVPCAHPIEIPLHCGETMRQDRAPELYCLLFQIRKHVPRSFTGVLIGARAVTTFEKAQKDSHQPGERPGDHILGRELAGAVPRLAA
jgi:hypothetical protein